MLISLIIQAASFGQGDPANQFCQPQLDRRNGIMLFAEEIKTTGFDLFFVSLSQLISDRMRAGRNRHMFHDLRNKRFLFNSHLQYLTNVGHWSMKACLALTTTCHDKLLNVPNEFKWFVRY